MQSTNQCLSSSAGSQPGPADRGHCIFERGVEESEEPPSFQRGNKDAKCPSHPKFDMTSDPKGWNLTASHLSTGKTALLGHWLCRTAADSPASALCGRAFLGARSPLLLEHQAQRWSCETPPRVSAPSLPLPSLPVTALEPACPGAGDSWRPRMGAAFLEGVVQSTQGVGLSLDKPRHGNY